MLLFYILHKNYAWEERAQHRYELHISQTFQEFRIKNKQL
jgi:hypothetical protein